MTQPNAATQHSQTQLLILADQSLPKCYSCYGACQDNAPNMELHKDLRLRVLYTEVGARQKGNFSHFILES